MEVSLNLNLILTPRSSDVPPGTEPLKQEVEKPINIAVVSSSQQDEGGRSEEGDAVIKVGLIAKMLTVDMSQIEGHGREAIDDSLAADSSGTDNMYPPPGDD
jgi:hypothetical protein